jgi:hypothetical protein
MHSDVVSKTLFALRSKNAGIKQGTLPAIGLFDVVEHIADDLQFLKQVHSALADNGYVFITVPAFGFLWSNEDVDAGHYRRYDLKAIKRVLEKANFTIAYATYIFSILPVPVFLFRTLPSRFARNKHSDDLNKHKREHQRKKGMVDAMLNRVWRYEVDRIKKGKSLPFGGSCFVVAQKK